MNRFVFRTWKSDEQLNCQHTNKRATSVSAHKKHSNKAEKVENEINFSYFIIYVCLVYMDNILWAILPWCSASLDISWSGPEQAVTIWSKSSRTTIEGSCQAASSNVAWIRVATDSGILPAAHQKSIILVLRRNSAVTKKPCNKG